MKPVAVLEISSCKDCPFFDPGHDYSLDGFDRGSDWKCKKENKVIAHFVEWHEEDKMEIPEWCPMIKKKKKK